MKDFLCPKKSSLKDDSNGTKNETDKQILCFFMIGQSFVKSIGVPPGAGAKLAGRRPALKELIGAIFRRFNRELRLDKQIHYQCYKWITRSRKTLIILKR